MLYKFVQSNPSVTSNSNLTELSSVGIKATYNENSIYYIEIIFFSKVFILLLRVKKEVEIFPYGKVSKLILI